ncbi:ABC transporter substrate-binding protein [Pseudorhodoferax sp.]|uniref:ABC transporter substrate-binding protein n=1 Tax=Pseudorhodoferax sp. TaxID=1993553 RepID=UPI002DD66493|nr:ABC transporter substrate-binding protein [Pseudorhodoferax sp.]
MEFTRRRTLVAALAGMAAFPAVRAQKRYGPGVTDTSITIGSTAPFSGPVSILGTLGKTAQAYVSKVNAEGGINGRSIKLIQYDDGYNPGKALEMTRKLVEQDQVLFVYQTVGTSVNNAVQRYLEPKKIPQLLIMSGANKWSDAKAAPMVVPGMPSYSVEGRVYARWVLEHMPKARIAVLMQNDDFGRDYLAGIQQGLGARGKEMIVAQSTYETTDASVDSQIVSLKGRGADVFFSLSNGKYTVQSLRKAHDIGWKPQVFLPLGSSSPTAIMRPAGPEKVVGAITAAYGKSAADPQWKDDKGILDLRAFAGKWMGGADPNDTLVSGGHASAVILMKILAQCGDDLTRENVMRQALSLRDFSTPTTLPGIRINTSDSSHAVYTQLWLQRFDGNNWSPFGGAVAL